MQPPMSLVFPSMKTYRLTETGLHRCQESRARHWTARGCPVSKLFCTSGKRNVQHLGDLGDLPLWQKQELRSSADLAAVWRSGHRRTQDIFFGMAIICSSSFCIDTLKCPRANHPSGGRQNRKFRNRQVGKVPLGSKALFPKHAVEHPTSTDVCS
ncbi:hypothetical protein N656DRAFT_344785 [Canariomyces notabilis]|uniref:Uncharacterized protein n=1 Tax=Canariomyces notabilis TaxID=2074819 RepID=A0AAN6QFH2_9PEZI|nr:hypothetical protein N656DRAFT_344785 [Canariomyces arenarius]